jgi:hypothetical protein
LQRGDAIVHRAPIGDHQALEAPLVFENVHQVVFRAVDAVEFVVGAHHGPGLRLFDGSLERRQVDLAQGALVHLGADGHALVFLVVGGKVLERSANALALHAVDQAGRQLAGQEGVLGKVLEVAPADRRALHVDAWS